MVNKATSTNITGGTTPTGGTITIPNGPNTITSGGSKMVTGTTIIIGATATGGLTITRNGSTSIIRTGSHGMTTGKTTITGMVINLIQSAELSCMLHVGRGGRFCARSR